MEPTRKTEGRVAVSAPRYLIESEVARTLGHNGESERANKESSQNEKANHLPKTSESFYESDAG